MNMILNNVPKEDLPRDFVRVLEKGNPTIFNYHRVSANEIKVGDWIHFMGWQGTSNYVRVSSIDHDKTNGYVNLWYTHDCDFIRTEIDDQLIVRVDKEDDEDATA